VVQVIEKHYTINELAERLTMSFERTRQLVMDEPGVLRIAAKTPGERRTRTMYVFLIHGCFRIPAVAGIGHERGHRHRYRRESGIRFCGRRGHAGVLFGPHWSSRLFPQDGEVAGRLEVAAFLRG
jgi:hypothetical protein